METEAADITTLTLDPGNVRRHGERNLEAIKGSLARWGQQKPIVVGPDDVVVAGNGTLEAARALGWDSIDVVRTDLTGAERTAFAIADNRTTDLSDFDDGLGELLQSLQQDDALDHLATGFTDAEIAELVGDAEPPNFEPASADDQSRLDEKAKVQCPHCGEEFTPK